MGKVSPPSISPETQGRLFEFCGVPHMPGRGSRGRCGKIQDCWEHSYIYLQLETVGLNPFKV